MILDLEGRVPRQGQLGKKIHKGDPSPTILVPKPLTGKGQFRQQGGVVALAPYGTVDNKRISTYVSGLKRCQTPNKESKNSTYVCGLKRVQTPNKETEKKERPVRISGPRVIVPVFIPPTAELIPKIAGGSTGLAIGSGPDNTIQKSFIRQRPLTANVLIAEREEPIKRRQQNSASRSSLDIFVKEPPKYIDPLHLGKRHVQGHTPRLKERPFDTQQSHIPYPEPPSVGVRTSKVDAVTHRLHAPPPQPAQPAPKGIKAQRESMEKKIDFIFGQPSREKSSGIRRSVSEYQYRDTQFW